MYNKNENVFDVRRLYDNLRHYESEIESVFTELGKRHGRTATNRLIGLQKKIVEYIIYLNENHEEDLAPF